MPTRVYVGNCNYGGTWRNGYADPNPKKEDNGAVLVGYELTADFGLAEIARIGCDGLFSNPSYVIADPTGSTLYVSNENADPVTGVSYVIAVAVDKVTGALTVLGKQDSCGQGCCHLEWCDSNGGSVLAANYTSGSIAAFPVTPGGSGGLSPATDSKQAKPMLPLDPALADRQEGPHAHQIKLDPWTGEWALVSDLGMDKIFVYTYNRELKTFSGAASSELHFDVQKGGGPRHLAFHPTLTVVYQLNELDATVGVLKFDPASGTLERVELVPALADGVTAKRDGHQGSADIHVHPNGRFMYCSNRSDNTLTTFAIDGADGRIKAIAHTSTGGEIPRNFVLAETFLIVANQDTRNVVTFSLDPATGALVQIADAQLDVSPTCLCVVTIDGSGDGGGGGARPKTGQPDWWG